MFHEEDTHTIKTIDLERLHGVLSFEEILEESDLTEEEVIEILYDLGYLKLPPYLLEENYNEV